LIDKLYLSRQRPSVAALHRTIALECFQAKIEAPSYKAVSTRVKCLDVGDVIRAREGPKASNQFRPVKGSLTAAEPLELVQIDHTLVDVIVVDDLDRKSIGRPWLSVAIDVATRAVTGFFLSLRGPSTTSAAMTINRSVLRKEAYLTGQQVEATWPIYGLPRVLHLDNAKEFRARALVRGCEQHGIQIVHRPPKTPRYGGHIERLIGTLMGEVHLLPGTTFSSVNDRGEYDSAGQAVMTMEELEKWVGLADRRRVPFAAPFRNRAEAFGSLESGRPKDEQTAPGTRRFEALLPRFSAIREAFRWAEWPATV
jgi:putative transposase